MNKYDYVQQYKGDLNQMPSKFRHLIVQKYLAQGYSLDDISKMILDVDIYVSIDLKNCWKKD